MPSTHDLRRRIKSIGSTSQITKAMQMVAASKMRKAQEAALTTRPFAQLLYRIQRHATTHAPDDFTHPLMQVREVRKRAVILVGTDNAAGLIRDLTLHYNNLRQGNITKELLEIAGGQLGND